MFLDKFDRFFAAHLIAQAREPFFLLTVITLNPFHRLTDLGRNAFKTGLQILFAGRQIFLHGNFIQEKSQMDLPARFRSKLFG